MRKEYSRALRDCFDREMRATLPEFQLLKKRSDYTIPGDRAYVRVSSKDLYCFIILVPGRRDGSEFTIEIGWSKVGRFPELGMRPSGQPQEDGREFVNLEFICRIGSLIDHDDVWWELEAEDQTEIDAILDDLLRSVSPEEARTAVEAKVKDAVAKVREFAVPYLDEFVRSQAGSKPS